MEEKDPCPVCNLDRTLLTVYLDKELLSAPEKADVATALDNCSGCKKAYQELELVKNTLPKWQVPQLSENEKKLMLKKIKNSISTTS